MITDMDAYLRFFDSVRRRTERDVAALPPEAAAWRPPATGGEAGWSIGTIVGQHRRLAPLLRERVSGRGLDPGHARDRPRRGRDVAALAADVGRALRRAPRGDAGRVAHPPR